MMTAKNVPQAAPVSTRITIRVPYSLAATLRGGAAREGVSINQYILYLLALGARGAI